MLNETLEEGCLKEKLPKGENVKDQQISRQNLQINTLHYQPTNNTDFFFFDLKRNRYNLRGNYLLNLPDRSTC